jgi:YbbR domain-containing protein
MLGLASLLIAMVLWLQVQPLYNPDRERELSVNLVVENLSAGLVAVQPPDTLRIVASGTFAEIEALDSSAFEAFVDAGEVKAGEAELPVQVRGPSRPTLTLRPVRPRIRIVAARVGRITKPVELQTTGLPPSELVYDAATIAPAEVLLTGPETSLAGVDRVRVTLDLTRVRPRSDFTLGVEVLDSQGRPIPLVRAEPEEVVVSPAVGSAPTRKRVVVNPIFVGQLPFGTTLDRYEIRPTQVELSGPSPDLARISTIDTEPIALDRITGEVTKTAALVVPQGLRVKGKSEVTVTLVPRSVTAAPAPAGGN